MSRAEVLIDELVRRGRLPDRKTGRRYFERFFAGTPLAGRAVLEIGSGRGEMCLWASCQGARRVVGLEPEAAGSTSESLLEFRRMTREMELDRVEPLPLSIQDYDPGDSRFDVVLSYSSINHLDEEACARLRNSPSARESYRRILLKINRMMAPGATIIVTDASRYNFFGVLGLRNPFDPSIDWKLHQSPRCWVGLMARAGFGEPAVSWFQPWFLEPFGILTKNEAVAFFLRSRFRLQMTKLEDVD